MGRIADECGEKSVEGQRYAADHERDEPGDEYGDDGDDRPQHEPDEVGNGEEEPEEDRQP